SYQKLKIPVWALYGEKDKIVDNSITALKKVANPDIQLVGVPGGGHYGPDEKSVQDIAMDILTRIYFSKESEEVMQKISCEGIFKLVSFH
ncbi:MAG: hypothetical protein KDD50_11845, partial [Bdellovibrionales bacterium]|nr:hypothetical protein [Bdellovibrionales bacterium]